MQNGALTSSLPEQQQKSRPKIMLSYKAATKISCRGKKRQEVE
jgi:hypothetical protein